MEATAKPLVTANQVTLLRLLPMPFYAWLLYHSYDRALLWTALILGSIIACTDFVDGFLARKYGPTILGGLLDPMADKVFVAFSFLPLADLGIVPWWIVALIFCRELLVTALRTCYKIRDVSLKTSYFGKLKTWTQMQALSFILFILLFEGTQVLEVAVWITLALPVIAGLAFIAIKKRIWKGSLFMMAGQGMFVASYYWLSAPDLILALMYVALAVTWLSGADYIIDAFKHLRGKGMLYPGEIIRLVGAIALPWLCLWLLAETHDTWVAIPPIIILSAELAVGGLDNLLAHHRAHSRAAGWGLRLGITCAGLALAALIDSDSLLALGGAWAAAGASVVGVGWEFYRGRRYYGIGVDAVPTDSAA